MNHIYQGHCPDPTQPDARDPSCQACRLLDRTYEHPLTGRRAPIQRILRDLAAQENCDGDPYDQMMQAADYIEELLAAIR